VVIEAHRKINCTTTEGAGFSIVWVLTIGNQTSQSPTTSYKAPTITSLRMASVFVNDVLVAASSPVGSLTSLATEGGEVLVLNGTDLGPSSNRTLVNAVSFSGGSFVYNLQNCSFVVAHQQLQCLTPPGVGSGFRAQVTVMYQSSGQSSDVLSYRAPSISVASPSVIPTSGATVTLNGSSFGASPEQISLFVNGVSTAVSLSVPHRGLQFRVDNPTGVASLSVMTVVGGQSSNSVTVSVGAPSVSTVDLYDVTVLPPAVQATDACFQAIVDVGSDTIFQFQGQNFGDSLVLLNVTVSNGTYSGLCVPCYARHTTARCKTSVSRGITYNVSLTLAGQSSGRVTYAFPALVDTTPPFVSSADSVTSGRSQLATIGGDTIVIVGTRLGANCSVTNASVGVYPLALSVCNSTTIVATTPAGAGVMGVVTVLVSGVSAVVGGGASAAFVYRPPAVTPVQTPSPDD